MSTLNYSRYKTKKSHSILTPGENHALITLIVTVIVVGGILFVINSISNTPLGKALGSLLGVLGGALAAVDKQLSICNKVGFMNVGKGCWIGFAAVSMAVLTLFSKMYKMYVNNKSSNENLENLSELTGDTLSEVMIKLLFGIDGTELDNAEINGVEVTDGVKSSTYVKIINERIVKECKSILDKQSKSPEEIHNVMKEVKRINKLILDKSIKETSEDNGDTIENTTNDVNELYEQKGIELVPVPV